jgi:hypothetical protein
MDSKRKGDDLDDFYKELHNDIGPSLPPSKLLKTDKKGKVINPQVLQRFTRKF